MEESSLKESHRDGDMPSANAAVPGGEAASMSSITATPVEQKEEASSISSASTHINAPIDVSDSETAGIAAFEFVESVVIDAATGDRLDADRVMRGSTRLETLHFKTNEPLAGLTRTVINYKNFPWPAGFQRVGVDVVKMGDYAVSAAGTTHSFEMPKAVIPTIIFAKGGYKIDIKYTAESHPGKVLTHIKHEFHVV
jgi:hypothetical protein